MGWRGRGGERGAVKKEALLSPVRQMSLVECELIQPNMENSTFHVMLKLETQELSVWNLDTFSLSRRLALVAPLLLLFLPCYAANEPMSILHSTLCHLHCLLDKSIRWYSRGKSLMCLRKPIDLLLFHLQIMATFFTHQRFIRMQSVTLLSQLQGKSTARYFTLCAPEYIQCNVLDIIFWTYRSEVGREWSLSARAGG